jgi:hypothetical protein
MEPIGFGEPYDPNPDYTQVADFGPPAYPPPATAYPSGNVPPPMYWNAPGYTNAPAYGYEPVYDQRVWTGYPGGAYYPQPNDRPGVLLAATVLAYIVAGLLFLTGIVVFLGAAAAANINDGYGTSTDATPYLFASVANMLAAALLIAGGVMITNGRLQGRTVVMIGTLICSAVGIFWLAHDPGTLGWVIAFCAPTVLATVLAFSKSASNWLQAAMPRTPYPPPFGC